MQLSRKEFDKLLEKYIQKKCTPGEQILIERWYKAIGNASGNYQEETHNHREEKIWKAIQEKTRLIEAPPFKQMALKKKMRRSSLVGIAASVFIVALAGIYLSGSSILSDVLPAFDRFKRNDLKSTIISIRNTDSKIVKPVRLNDGSLVVLQPNSEIKCAQPFADGSREVTLTGEAFFEVTRDTLHPFFVYSQALVTQVLGTSFNIKARPEDKTIIVDVKTGRVAVYTKSNKELKNEYVLMPNQQAIYNCEAGQIVQQLQESPQIIIAEKEISEMKFDEAPASVVFEALEKAYGVDLIYDEAVFVNCTLTTQLSNEGLYEKLKIICKALGAVYETKETQIFIEGKGCD